MIQQGFSLGERDWYIMCAYDIRTKRDLAEVRRTLLAAGCDEYKADEAISVLSMWNKGFTFTNFADHLTIVCISKATSAEQMYDSIAHEQKHIVEHISEYYGVDPKGETAAYLQGEIGRQIFPVVAMLICPRNV
jgi:hypothetical protein